VGRSALVMASTESAPAPEPQVTPEPAAQS
jgi:hypothetical protein